MLDMRHQIAKTQERMLALRLGQPLEDKTMTAGLIGRICCACQSANYPGRADLTATRMWGPALARMTCLLELNLSPS